MIDELTAKRMINELLEEEAFLIGGLVAVYRVDDGLVWRLMKNFDIIRRKALRHLDAQKPDGEGTPNARRPNLKPHPAVEDFLFTIRRDMNQRAGHREENLTRAFKQL